MQEIGLRGTWFLRGQMLLNFPTQNRAVGLKHKSHSTGHSLQVMVFTFWKVILTLNLANPRPKVGF